MSENPCKVEWDVIVEVLGVGKTPGKSRVTFQWEQYDISRSGSRKA